MLSREGGRDAALRFQMASESWPGGGEGNVVFKMEEDDFNRHSLPRGRA